MAQIELDAILSGAGSLSAALQRNVEDWTAWSESDPDSREDGTVQFMVNATGEEVPGALLIATVTTGASGVTQIVDERTYTRALTALAAATGSDDDLQAIRDAIGSEYFGASPPLSLDARLDDLESAAAANDGTGAVYWGTLNRAAGGRPHRGPGLPRRARDRAGDAAPPGARNATAGRYIVTAGQEE